LLLFYDIENFREYEMEKLHLAMIGAVGVVAGMFLYQYIPLVRYRYIP